MYQKIMVPLDGSELAECVLPHVIKLLSEWDNPSVVLVSALENPVFLGGGDVSLPGDMLMKVIEDHRSYLEEYLEKQQQHLANVSNDIQTVILEAEPNTAQSLADYAEKNGIDLIVMATHGRSGISRWAMGSIAEKLLKSSCIPVFLVRAPGCVAGV